MARMLPSTPLVPSRSLGRLLGLDRLAFKLEGSQPAGSWLDRGAALIVVDGAHERGLLAVGSGPLGPALALHGARTGQIVHLFVDANGAATSDLAWAAALGARMWPVAADGATLQATMSELAAAHGWRYVSTDDACLRQGVHGALVEIVMQQDGALPEIIAVAPLLGPEAEWLTAMTDRTAIVKGMYPAGDRTAPPEADEARLVTAALTARDLDAARRLLAREEGLIASRRGVAGLAALMRTRRDRRLSKRSSAVVLLANEVGGLTDGPPIALDEALECQPLTLDALRADLRGALLRPPG
jgi:threonine synthase